MEQKERPIPMSTTRTSPGADTIQWGDQTAAVFYPRPFLKTEQIFVDQHPPVKTEPAYNEDVKYEAYPELIKCEREIKEDPDLIGLKIEPVELDSGPVKTESTEFSTFLDNSPSSSFPQIGELFSFTYSNQCYTITHDTYHTCNTNPRRIPCSINYCTTI